MWSNERFSSISTTMCAAPEIPVAGAALPAMAIPLSSVLGALVVSSWSAGAPPRAWRPGRDLAASLAIALSGWYSPMCSSTSSASGCGPREIRSRKAAGRRHRAAGLAEGLGELVGVGVLVVADDGQQVGRHPGQVVEVRLQVRRERRGVLPARRAGPGPSWRTGAAPACSRRSRQAGSAAAPMFGHDAPPRAAGRPGHRRPPTSSSSRRGRPAGHARRARRRTPASNSSSRDAVGQRHQLRRRSSRPGCRGAAGRRPRRQ